MGGCSSGFPSPPRSSGPSDSSPLVQSFEPESVIHVAQSSTLSPPRRAWREREPWCLLAHDATKQLLISACVLATLVITFVVYPHHRDSVSIDGALYIVAVTMPAVAMIITAHHSPERRRPWLFMAGGVVANSLADIVYATYDERQHPVPNPGVSDAFYLVSYASFVVAILLLTRARDGRPRASQRLDGFISAAALASLVSFVGVNPLAARGGGTLHVVVDLAYPIFDLVMLMLLATSLAPRRYRPTWSSGLLLGGVAWLLLGDVLHVTEIASNGSHAVSFTDFTFVLGVWMMGLSASVEDRRTTSRRSPLPRHLEASLSVAAIPVLSGIIAIGVIAASWKWNRPPEVGALALAGLAMIMVRMWLALREERRLVLSSSRDARTDALTGLANRRQLFERIEELLSDEGTRHVGIILIDLDGFKEVNDEIGHAAGDELLRIISQRFTRRLADRGNLARLGGDEFAVVHVATEAELLALARELLATTNEEFSLQGRRVRLGASMVVAISDHTDIDSFELLRRADVAMYRAKKLRVGVEVFAASADTTADHDFRREDPIISITIEDETPRST